MKLCHQHTYQVSDLNTTSLETRDCIKVRLRNESSGIVVVEGLPIHPGASEEFDLPAGHVFAKNFDVDMSQAISAALFVTRFFYANQAGEYCSPLPDHC